MQMAWVTLICMYIQKQSNACRYWNTSRTETEMNNSSSRKKEWTGLGLNWIQVDWTWCILINIKTTKLKKKIFKSSMVFHIMYPSKLVNVYIYNCYPLLQSIKFKGQNIWNFCVVMVNNKLACSLRPYNPIRQWALTLTFMTKSV